MSALKSWGIEVTDRLCPADIYVLNTCAVTREAEKKSRQLVARARKFSPEAKVFVVGCASEKDAAAFKEKGVFYVGGARRKNELIAALAHRLGAEYACVNNSQGYEILPEPMQARTRAFIKIEDGCNNFCSYCVIPYLRGRVRSRAPEEILCEAQNCGCAEVVLTGINISAYCCENCDLAGLLGVLAPLEKRIRLGSVECGVIDERFLQACRNLKNFAPQFHLSLQSGSDSVLRAMNRRYTRAQYLEACALIGEYFPDAAVTTDLIVGFPTETEEDFGQSLSIVREAGLARVHAFPYSARPGTVAAKKKPLPDAVRRERMARMLACAREAEEDYLARFAGRTFPALFEEDGGYTPNYIRVYAEGVKEGGMYEVRLDRREKDGYHAAVIKEI